MRSALSAYRYRLKRRNYLWRCFRSRHQLRQVVDNTHLITPDDHILVCCFRNESARLPWFMAHYRRLGVTRFLMIDNNSTDGSADLLRGHSDVSLWHSDASYRAARFGVDWVGWLLLHYGRGHWCLTVDVDELLIYPHHDSRPLPDLTAWLHSRDREAYGALMLDLYPKGPLGAGAYTPGTDPVALLPWFDGTGYRAQRKEGLQNLWVQGGPRDRVFFHDQPARAPTLNKLPLVHWQRPYAYVNSTHSILPRRLNQLYDGPGGPQPGGILLHSKFLPDVTARSADDKRRQEHFTRPEDFTRYYDEIIAQPEVWHPGSFCYKDWKQFVDLGLMPEGTWR